MNSPYLDQSCMSAKDRAGTLASYYIRRARQVLKAVYPDRDITISVMIQGADQRLESKQDVDDEGFITIYPEPAAAEDHGRVVNNEDLPPTFAGNSRIAGPFTNDLNPASKASGCLDARDYLNSILTREGQTFDSALFDPPYSPRQIPECYKSFGKPVSAKDTQNSVLNKECRDLIDRLLKPGGVVLSFGWNSVGLGKVRGYVLEEILLVCHGGAHNDTICIAERKEMA